jgi:cell division protease FtsH
LTARGIVTTSAYVLEHNKRRLLILLGIVALVLFFYGIRNVFEGFVAFLGSMPALVIQLLFLLVAGIAQFAGLMWFLSRPRTYTVTPDSPQIGLTFENYRGQPDLLEHAKSTVRILRGVQRFVELGGEVPRGMLLSGKPGTGKTFLAGVIAAEANLPFIYVDASSLSSMWFGVDALIVMSLFRRARGLARRYRIAGTPGACILFIDELDSIGMSRSGVQGAGQQMMMGGMMGMGRFGLNAMLNQMDSLGQHVEDRWKHKMLRWLGVVRGPVPPKPVVFVIGATNRPDVLDPALVRPGRLDRRLNVYEPDAPGRKDIIEHYLAQKAHDQDIDVKMMVADSIGWTPIELKTIINEALIIAHDQGRESLNYRDWLQARDTRQLGLKQPISSMSDKDKRTIAYHEAGHAVAARYLNLEDRIQKASIIRMGDALGVVQWSPKEERYQLHQQEMEQRIMVALGSRAVEELYLGTKTANASHDLQSATGAAMAYVGTFGMGPTLLAIPQSPMGGTSPQVLRLADHLLDTLYADTKRLMREKEYAVHAVANALLAKGELIGPELEEIFVYADEANPEHAKPFERKSVELPKLFEEENGSKNGSLTKAAAAELI